MAATALHRAWSRPQARRSTSSSTSYVVVSLSNLDPPAASQLVEFFTLCMPDH